VKIGLATTLGVYLALTVVGYALRGANWSLVLPGRTGGAGIVLSRLGTIDGAPLFSQEAKPIPVVLGRPEGCLVCHSGMTGFSPSHEPDAIGCASCHAGNPFSATETAAHAGMILVPGNLANAARACGTAACHPSVVERVQHSIMTTMAGIVAVDREVFGHADPAGAPAPHVEDLGHSLADTHLRQLCASCHLGAAKAAWGPVHARRRLYGMSPELLRRGARGPAPLRAGGRPRPRERSARRAPESVPGHRQRALLRLPQPVGPDLDEL
jgi:hypothetical protein